MENYTIAKDSFPGRRENNEDACLVLKLGDKGLFLAVADGMGGYEGGEIASNLVLFKIKLFLEKNYHDLPGPERLKSIIAECFELAQYTIYQKIQEEPALKGMGTTLSAVLIYDNHFACGNIGDSRIYKLSGAAVYQITLDHTYIEEFRQKFQEPVSPEFLSQYGHILTRTIDGKQDLPDIFPDSENYLTLKADEILLLCTDGLLLDKSDISNSFISEPLTNSPNLEAAVNQLISNAYEGGSNDNITVVLARYNSQVITREVQTSVKHTIPGPETIRIPAYVRKEKVWHQSKKGIKTIAFAFFALFLLCIIAGFLYFKPFKPEEAGKPTEKTMAPVKGAETGTITPAAEKVINYPYQRINTEREKYLGLVSHLISYKAPSKALDEMLKDIRAIKPAFVKRIEVDHWDAAIKAQWIPEEVKKGRLIVKPGLIVRQLDREMYLIILYDTEQEEVIGNPDFIGKSGMQFYAGVLGATVDRYFDLKKIAGIADGQVLYLVKYDKDGTMDGNPGHFEEEMLTGEAIKDKAISFSGRYKNRPVVEITVPLKENTGRLRVGLPFQAGN